MASPFGFQGYNAKQPLPPGVSLPEEASPFAFMAAAPAPSTRAVLDAEGAGDSLPPSLRTAVEDDRNPRDEAWAQYGNEWWDAVDYQARERWGEDWDRLTDRESHRADLERAIRNENPNLQPWEIDAPGSIAAVLEAIGRRIGNVPGGGGGGGESGGGESGGGGGGGSFGSGGGGAPPADIQAELDRLMALLENLNFEEGLDVNLPGPGELPVIEVPGADLSPDLDASILSLLRGEDDTTRSLNQAIYNLVQEAGGNPQAAEDRAADRALLLQDRFQRAQQGLVEQGRANLANRGLASQPGVPQGAEGGLVRRITERIAPDFAAALREVELEESARADERQLQALSLATGFSDAQARRVLDAIGAGQQRQQMLADIALDTLDRNIYWNQFLAEFGLQREELMHTIRQGNLTLLIPLFEQFQQLLSQARGGYIGA